MTISEMHRAVKLELDKSSALELPAFEPEELDYWINRAISDYVKDKCQNIEKNQSYIDDLKTLIESYTPTLPVPTTISNNLEEYDFDISSIQDTYYKFIKDEVKILFTDSAIGVDIDKWQGLTEVTHDNYREYLDNPYSEHILHYGEAKPLRYFSNNLIVILTDGSYDITDYNFKYIRLPASVYLDLTSVASVDCDLPIHIHQEIVKLTALTLMENIESIRSQTFLRVNKVN
jgi:hypothetical protein